MDTKKVSPYTDYYFARPSIIEGIGRIVDFFGLLQVYNTSSTPEIADMRAIRADWAAVGSDMKAVLQMHGRTSRSSKNGACTSARKEQKQSHKAHERGPVVERA